jgi:hypothetical protein
VIRRHEDHRAGVEGCQARLCAYSASGVPFAAADTIPVLLTVFDKAIARKYSNNHDISAG